MIKSWTTKNYWNQINRDRFSNSTTSDFQIHILQTWTISAKAFMPPLIKDSANNLKLCWRRNFVTYVLARVLNSRKRLIKLSYTKSMGFRKYGYPRFNSEPYLELWQTSKVEHFVKIFNVFQPLALFAKQSILDA